ncbi:MAG: DUF721 domain-containing protein [Spirochaetes bacterium]|nr:DUF721 domain-containing protein [Spirochaetota bacterium]
MEKAGDLVKEYLDSLRLNKKTGNVEIFKGWYSLVDSSLASHSKVFEFEKSVLYVEVDHPGWAQTIFLKKKGIMGSIRKEYPGLEIKDIRVIINSGKERY